MKPAKSYHDDLIKDLKDTREAAAYLNAALEDGNKEVFLLALRNVLEAQGGMSKFSRDVKMHRVSLYKMLSKRGNPEFDSVLSLLHALGVRFQITVKTKSKVRKQAA